MIPAQGKDARQLSGKVFHCYCGKPVTNPVQNIQQAPESAGSSMLLKICAAGKRFTAKRAGK
jgi:hypothetical protein